ncbi:hypothetical protein F5Y17DRAFT_182169 [Xylariaceae sp. FL0594]|nr:hypothetical protein F5Y17DRAFT_182169 [Xylariaceae sp. FL0594]
MASPSALYVDNIRRKRNVWGQMIVDSFRLLGACRKARKLLMTAAYSVVMLITFTAAWFYAGGHTGAVVGPGVPRDLGQGALRSASEAAAAAPAAGGNPGGGLRIVVFGGGDVATPGNYTGGSKSDERHLAWTEVMCQHLGCDTYLSFVPEAEGMSGAIMSNPLLQAAHQLLAAHTDPGPQSDGKEPELDYSWVPAAYPVPSSRPDLASQIDEFLSSPKQEAEEGDRAPTPPPAETLWVFNVGYTDIWNLVALPRHLATEVLDADLTDMFFQIKRLYTASQRRDSAAYSNFYSPPHPHSKSSPFQYKMPTPNSSLFSSSASYLSSTSPFMSRRADSDTQNTDMGKDMEMNSMACRREPFRIFITQAFDVTLTPGWENSRAKPPSPHTLSDHMRNAAFLTEYWNRLLRTAVDDWLDSLDPADWSTADAVDINVLSALSHHEPIRTESQMLREMDINNANPNPNPNPKSKSKSKTSPPSSSGKGTDGKDQTQKQENRVTDLTTDANPNINTYIALPRRQAASYSISRYIRELLIDHQMRDSNLSDAKGFGTRPLNAGFEHVDTSCVSRRRSTKSESLEEVEVEVQVCAKEVEDEYLFYDDFTVGPRAVREIGVLAARRLMDQVEVRSRWRSAGEAWMAGMVANGAKEGKKAVRFRA